MPFEDFVPVYGGVPQFQIDMSQTLGITPNNIEVTDYYEGSVIIEYNLVEDLENDLDLEQLQKAYEEKLLLPSQDKQSTSSDGISSLGSISILSIEQLTSGTGSPIHSKVASPISVPMIVSEELTKQSSPTLIIITCSLVAAGLILVIAICFMKKKTN